MTGKLNVKHRITFLIGYFFPGQLPGVGGEDEGNKEKDAEEERLRQEAMKEAEAKRRLKHQKIEAEREGMRQGIREKVHIIIIMLWPLAVSGTRL